MKRVRLIALAAMLIAIAAVVIYAVGQSKLGGETQRASADGQIGSLYELSTRTLEGEPVDLAEYRGNVALVVNVASKCGLTPQYKGLEALQRDMGFRGFVVLGFPSNDFMSQEPGSPAEIREFCDQEYGVTFPLFEKRVVTGEGKDEVYAFLSQQVEEPTWNFTKYLVDSDGKVVARFAPKTWPDDHELRAAIETELHAATRVRLEGGG